MCGLLSGSRLQECKVCSRWTAEQNMNTCLACIKFLFRNQGKTLICRSGTNDCQLTATRAAIFCQNCRLQSCLVATEGCNLSSTTRFKCSSPSSPQSPSLSPSSNSLLCQRGNSQHPLEAGAEEAIENFEITWIDWLSIGSQECLTRMISETIYQFSQRIPNFTKLTPNIQLMLNFQATPLLCLILALSSHLQHPDVAFIYKLFPRLKLFDTDLQNLPDRFNKWQPSPLEIGCLMAVTMFRNCGENDDISIANILHSIDTSLSTINQSGRKAHFIDILSAILPKSSYFFSFKI